MDDSFSYSVWYHKIFNTTKKGDALFRKYGDYQTLYDHVVAGEEDSFLEAARIAVIKKYSAVDALRIVEECEENDWQIVSRDSSLYPDELKELDGMPHVLFCDGDISLLTSDIKFAIVGSRSPTQEAQQITFNSAYNLASTGAVVVSGAALGIDSAAHLGAVKSGGKTIGVLGCGLGNGYMDRIGGFYDKIKENGLFISPFLPFSDSSRYTFPDRNRIISGLSQAVLVTYASEKSGSLITAGAAKKQNRRVYAMASEICHSDGCNKLISEGAYVFYNAGDMAYPFKELYSEGAFNEGFCAKPVNPRYFEQNLDFKELPAPKKTKSSAEKKASVSKEAEKAEAIPEKNENSASSIAASLPDYLSDEAKKIYDALGGSPENINDLVLCTGLRITQVLIGISELEAELLVKRLVGNRIEKI